MGKAGVTDGVHRINLALQGGGSHGAFTWGVLDRLLEDGRIDIEGISGTSAGAMNAAALAQGWMAGGADGARQSLEKFWRRISDFAHINPLQRSLVDRLLGNWNLDRSPMAYVMDLMQHALSPYQTNPAGLNPLRGVLEDMIDIEAIRACREIKLFIAATNVETGQARVFERHEMTVDALLASACLPFAFQAVEIDGVPYWDGGYMGNPVIWPMIYKCQSRDIVLVQINPMVRRGTPKSTTEIINRVNEISFNSSLLAEMRAISFVSRLLRDGELGGHAQERFKDIHLHAISDEEVLRSLGAASKMNAEWDFLCHMRDAGRAAAGRWLDTEARHLGKRSGLNVDALLRGTKPKPAPVG
ncbi:MAG TPA: patatin-like phospholipase family protein [Azospirillaceae bacterium]|nr:patatin-like phospholipase family protein [Azospirillaceae bacterium]